MDNHEQYGIGGACARLNKFEDNTKSVETMKTKHLFTILKKKHIRTFTRMAIVIFVVCFSYMPNKAYSDVIDTIKADISEKIMDIYDESTGEPVTELEAGESYLLAVNTENMESAKNYFKALYRTDYGSGNKGSWFAKFRIDPSKEPHEVVSLAGTPDNLLLWTVDAFDLDTYRENGFIQIPFNYYRPGIMHEMTVVKYYNFLDKTIDPPVIVINKNRTRNITVNVGYLGNSNNCCFQAVKPEPNCCPDMVMDEFKQRFRKATKGYAGMAINYLGRKNFPADGTAVGGKYHNYTDWWNSLPHDLEGTTLTPLDPSEPWDMRYIIMAWYGENRKQLAKDLKELFDTDNLEGPTVIFVELEDWAAGANQLAKVPIYGWIPFVQSGQWGMPQYVSTNPLPMDELQELALHELGHELYLSHPDNLQIPAGENWKTEMDNLYFEGISNMMGYGEPNYYYIDKDIKTILEPHYNLNLNTTPKLKLPWVLPVGENFYGSQRLIVGIKDAGSSIIIRGEEAVAANNDTLWMTNVDLYPGKNRIEIAQAKNGETSQSHIIHITRILSSNATQPRSSISSSELSTGVVSRGELISFYLKAEAKIGLKNMEWWIEKNTGSGWTKLDGYGHHFSLFSSAEAEMNYFTGIEEPGEYRLRAVARDRMYTPNNEEGHISTIKQITFTVWDGQFNF